MEICERHKPSGETWVVAGVDHAKRKVIPAGYPFPSVADAADCELLERRYETEFQSEDVINEFKKLGMLNFIDVRSAMFLGLMPLGVDDGD